MSPEPADWDDYLSDPRERRLNTNLPPREDLEEVRKQITVQQLSITSLEGALFAARQRLDALHRKHAYMLLADAEAGDDPANM